MFKDRFIVWVLEYVVGVALVLALVPISTLWWDNWSESYTWSVLLFAICLGICLVSSASSMRQRMIMTKKLEQLREQIAAAKA